MRTAPKHRLLDVQWPQFGGGAAPAPAAALEFQQRIDAARVAMEKRGLTHLVVYADREHFANLAYLTNFDPRFEEALLILRLDEAPLLLVGNECVGRVPVSPLATAGRLRSELYQPFSLLSQARDRSRLLRDIFASEGVAANAVIGCVGWKYFSDAEHPDSAHAIELPAYIVDTLRGLAHPGNVVNATAMLMDPVTGARTRCSPAEIAYFEYANVLSSEAVRRVIFGLEDGITDLQLAQRFEYNGLPLSCHVGMKTPGNRAIGLTGPVGSRVRRGHPFSTNFGYWGSNTCRAGWVVEHARELPVPASDYVRSFAGPYFEAMVDWYRLLRIGTPGGAISAMIQARLPFDTFGVSLNPGHLIHLDEWVSSPIYAGSTDELRSGMYLQSDVIPRSITYFSTRMEDGVVLADRALREDLARLYPECYARCQRRRAFMTDVLGFELADEVLPLSNIPALVPPFLLRPERVLGVER